LQVSLFVHFKQTDDSLMFIKYLNLLVDWIISNCVWASSGYALSVGHSIFNKNFISFLGNLCKNNPFFKSYEFLKWVILSTADFSSGGGVGLKYLFI